MLDSSGSFRLDPQRAREKLRVFQEALPAYAALRIIQGLHQLQARAVAVEVHSKRLVIEASFDQAPFDLELLRGAFLGQAGLGEAALASLAAGLNASLLDQPIELTCSLSGPRGELAWNLLEDSIEVRPRSQGGWLLRVVHAFPSSFLGFSRRRVLLHRELQTRCRFAPCDFKLDGRELDHDWEQFLGSEDEATTIGAMLEYLVPGQGFWFTVGDLSPYRLEGEALIWSRTEPIPLAQYRGRFFPAQLYLGVDPERSGRPMGCRTVLSCFELHRETRARPCKVHLMRHGVLGETYADRQGLPESYLLLDVSDLAADLSGLQTVRDEAFETRWNEARQDMRRAVETMLVHLRGTTPLYLSSAVAAYLARSPGFTSRLTRQLAARALGWAANSNLAQKNLALVEQQLEAWLTKESE
ncbi:MAG: hypothetical protein AB7S38_01600 [Vulcanimicrobiota bacterium]